jgi:hypothetical protein
MASGILGTILIVVLILFVLGRHRLDASFMMARSSTIWQPFSQGLGSMCG